jgi:hypothetical protein
VKGRTSDGAARGDVLGVLNAIIDEHRDIA